MADDFQVELEKLVARHARALADDVTTLILGRLGVAARPPRSPVGASAPKGAAKRGEAKGTVAPVRRRKRSSSGERDDVMGQVAGVVSSSEGVSAGDVERLTRLSRAQVVVALRALKESGRIFMAGEKRLARYGATRAIAERASHAARAKSAS